MVSRTRLKSLLTGLALYTMAAADGRLFRRQRLYRQIRAERAAGTRPGDHRADLGTGAAEARARRRASSGCRCCGPTGSTPTCWTSARATSSTTPIRATWSGPSSRTEFSTDVTDIAVGGLTSARRSANFKKLQNRFRKCRVALQCGIAIFSLQRTQSFHGGLSWVREGYPSLSSGIAMAAPKKSVDEGIRAGKGKRIRHRNSPRNRNWPRCATCC